VCFYTRIVFPSPESPSAELQSGQGAWRAPLTTEPHREVIRGVTNLMCFHCLTAIFIEIVVVSLP
jgi:hypothetical protein